MAQSNFNTDFLLEPNTLDPGVEDLFKPSALTQKKSNLAQAGKDKSNNLGYLTNNKYSGEDLQYAFSRFMNDRVWTGKDNKQYIRKEVKDANGNVKFVKVPFTGDTEALYLDNTQDEAMKLGKARTDVKSEYTPFQARYMDKREGNKNPYTNELTPNQKYNGTPGPKGVTPEDGPLLEVIAPKERTNAFETLINQNILMKKARVAKDVNPDNPDYRYTDAYKKAKALYGGGVTEYRDANAPLYNAEVTPGTSTGEPILTTQKQPEQSIDDQVDAIFAATGNDDSSGYMGNLVNSVKAGAATTAAGIGDAVLSAAVNLGKSLSDSSGLGIIDDKIVTEAKGYFDKYKDSEWANNYFNYDPTFKEEQLEKGYQALTKGNIPTAIYETVKAGPDVFFGSLPYMVLLFNPYGFGAMLGSEFNDSVEAYNKNHDGKEASVGRLTTMFIADAAKLYTEKITFGKAVAGKTVTGSMFSKFLKDVPQSFKKNVAKELTKKLGLLAGNAAEESSQEGIQYLIDYFNREYGTKNDKGLNTKELIKSMQGGFAAGTTVSGTKMAAKAPIGLINELSEVSYRKGLKKTAENLSPEDKAYVEDLDNASMEAIKERLDATVNGLKNLDNITEKNYEEIKKNDSTGILAEAEKKAISKAKNILIDKRLGDADFQTKAKKTLTRILSTTITKVKTQEEFTNLLKGAGLNTVLPINSSSTDIKNYVSKLPITALKEAGYRGAFSSLLKGNDAVEFSIENDVKPIAKTMYEDSNKIAQAAGEKLEAKITAEKKAKTIQRSNEPVEVKSKLDDKLLSSIFKRKSINKAIQELKAYTTPALEEALTRPDNTDRLNRVISKVINDRKTAEQLSDVGGAVADLPRNINVKEVLASTKREDIISTIRHYLKPNKINFTEDVNAITDLIDSAVKAGSLNTKQATILKKRLARISKDHKPAKVLKQTKVDAAKFTTEELATQVASQKADVQKNLQEGKITSEEAKASEQAIDTKYKVDSNGIPTIDPGQSYDVGVNEILAAKDGVTNAEIDLTPLSEDEQAKAIETLKNLGLVLC